MIGRKEVKTEIRRIGWRIFTHPAPTEDPNSPAGAIAASIFGVLSLVAITYLASDRGFSALALIAGTAAVLLGLFAGPTINLGGTFFLVPIAAGFATAFFLDGKAGKFDRLLLSSPHESGIELGSFMVIVTVIGCEALYWGGWTFCEGKEEWALLGWWRRFTAEWLARLTEIKLNPNLWRQDAEQLLTELAYGSVVLERSRNAAKEEVANFRYTPAVANALVNQGGIPDGRKLMPPGYGAVYVRERTKWHDIQNDLCRKEALLSRSLRKFFAAWDLLKLLKLLPVNPKTNSPWKDANDFRRSVR